jgi:hypothetical protein
VSLAGRARATGGRPEREGTTLRALVEEGPRRVLHDRERMRRFRLRNASYKGKGLNPALAPRGELSSGEPGTKPFIQSAPPFGVR